MSKKVAIGLSGTIGIFITLLMYFLFVERLFEVPVKWLSMIFVLLSELIAVIKGMIIKKGIISVARLTTGVLAFILTVLTAVLFVNMFIESIKGFIFMNALFLALEAIVDTLLEYLSKRENGL